MLAAARSTRLGTVAAYTPDVTLYTLTPPSASQVTVEPVCQPPASARLKEACEYVQPVYASGCTQY